MPRKLPGELAQALRLAHGVELAAGSWNQLTRARQGTAALLAAARAAGWSAAELGSVLGISRGAVQNRVDRRRITTPWSGLNVAVPTRIERPVPLRKVPVEQRDWLYAGEAGGVARSTLEQWRRAGLLPATRQFSRAVFMYARSDVERVMAAPSYNNHGVDRATVLEWINGSGG